SKTITVDRALICPPMTKKSKWNFNKMYEFKNPQDNQWYPGIITNIDSDIQTLLVEISADGTGIGINTLTRRDYRRDKKCQINNEKPHYIYEKYSIRLSQLLPLSRQIFENLLADDLIMGRINFSLESCNNSVNEENMKAFYLQIERCNLIEAILYQDSIDHLLQKWQNIIRTMAFEAAPKKIGSLRRELRLNNYQCSDNWYQDFLVAAKSHTDCHLIIKNIIVLEPAEVIYKLIKSDDLTQSHPQFNSICTHLEVLSSEKVVYKRYIRSQTTNVIPGQEFLEFFYKIESLILLLFKKYNEYGPNILEYICNSLLCNLPLLRSFNMLLDIASRSSSLQENLKGMYNVTQTSPKIDKKLMLIKKTNIPTDPLLGLKQLQIWAQLDGAEKVFSRIFLVSELQWLLWAFGDSTTKKQKKNLISSILNHLQKGTQFCEEAILKGQIFAL
ncbi:42478_t:CDS:2, partial [Gigaspora margarita]